MASAPKQTTKTSTTVEQALYKTSDPSNVAAPSTSSETPPIRTLDDLKKTFLAMGDKEYSKSFGDTATVTSTRGEVASLQQSDTAPESPENNGPSHKP